METPAISPRFCRIRSPQSVHGAYEEKAGVECPSHCTGEDQVLVIEPLVMGKFGPVVPKLGHICCEAPEPLISYPDTAVVLYKFFKGRKNQQEANQDT